MSENLDDRALTIARLRARWTTKVTCAIAADQIEADRREIEQLRATLLRALDPTITSIAIRNGGLAMDLEGTAVRAIAESFAAEFEQSDATNYLECTFVAKEGKNAGVTFMVTVQRTDCPTPHQLRAQAESERDALRARIDDAATVTMIGISPTAGYLGYTNPSGGFFESSFEDCPECPILGKRVALVPLDD